MEKLSGGAEGRAPSAEKKRECVTECWVKTEDKRVRGCVGRGEGERGRQKGGGTKQTEKDKSSQSVENQTWNLFD